MSVHFLALDSAGRVPGSGIAGSRGNSMWNFLRREAYAFVVYFFVVVYF